MLSHTIQCLTHSYFLKSHWKHIDEHSDGDGTATAASLSPFLLFITDLIFKTLISHSMGVLDWLQYYNILLILIIICHTFFFCSTLILNSKPSLVTALWLGVEEEKKSEVSSFILQIHIKIYMRHKAVTWDGLDGNDKYIWSNVLLGGWW